MPGSYLLKKSYLQIISKTQIPTKCRFIKRTDITKVFCTTRYRDNTKTAMNGMKMKIRKFKLIQNHRER